MPVRRIGLCYRSVGGRVPMGAGRPAVSVESTLERDFALLQRFDPAVHRIEEQPVRIEYRTAGGARRSYVPDFLVTYRTDRPTGLVEVKFSTDTALVAGHLAERFDAAEKYARRRGWVFAVVTEKEIRTPRLTNATFLLPFRSRTPDLAIRARIMIAIRPRPWTIQALADHVAAEAGSDRASILPTLWTLIANFAVAVDLNSPLTMETQLTAVPL